MITKPFQTLMMGFSAIALAGTAAIAATPATAGTLANPVVSGSDYLTYGSDSTNTFLVPNTPGNVQTALTGDSSNPTGNVELFASSEQPGANFNQVTSLSGTLGGKGITLSNLTLSDWLSPVGSSTFGQVWFNAALNSNGLGGLSSTLKGLAFTAFQNYGGFQRFSDPNISYVNQDSSGLVRIGLAGHFNATSLITASIDGFLNDSSVPNAAKLLANNLKSQLSGRTIQASEVVKVAYNGGPSQLLYSFNATQSGLVERGDQLSHTGNYEVTFQGDVPPQDVPEPSLLLGLVGLGGAFLLKRQGGQGAA